jgi:ribosome modulation factor
MSKRTANKRSDPNEPYRQGFDAGRAGRSLASNPHMLQSREGDDWEAGWHKGRSLYEAVSKAKEESNEVSEMQ